MVQLRTKVFFQRPLRAACPQRGAYYPLRRPTVGRILDTMRAGDGGGRISYICGLRYDSFRNADRTFTSPMELQVYGDSLLKAALTSRWDVGLFGLTPDVIFSVGPTAKRAVTASGVSTGIRPVVDPWYPLTVE